jgi:LPXTG-motif cell wall-anchored protein
LFGYQTGQSAYVEDIAKFSGRTFRAWNTLVYDALVEYDRVTENGNTFIKVRRDEDGTVLADDDNNPILENDYAAVSENGLSISVKNEPGAALPNTGGPGTNLIYIFGIMLTGLAGVGLVMKRRRRNAA